ncbi:CKS-domain-containing protein [Dendrothele bispora CBS 962.96]|uniref:Cyclin-dependent kinases regulatory subunit n=1 Tax=Dendrothele bispora (strain CBS 962.96) TaxID=1314807 RepID=A0A4V6T577_DENBC|nr:CKS-domain-containing protein [Dendrothele bispora CBS 962.96]
MATEAGNDEARKQAEQKKLEEILDRINYSDRYTDDHYEYRHVILPKQLLKYIPENYWDQKTGALRLLSDREWRAIGIQQSLGWEHYEIHGVFLRYSRLFLRPLIDRFPLVSRSVPEPHVLLFRRAKDYVAPAQPVRAKERRK